MKHVSIATMLLVVALTSSAFAQSKYTQLDTVAAVVFFTTDLMTTVVNGIAASSGGGSRWAIPVGLISGGASVLYGAERSAPILVFTGALSIVAGALHLHQQKQQTKRQESGRLSPDPRVTVEVS